MLPLVCKQQPHARTYQVYVYWRFQRDVGRFQGSTLWMGGFPWTAGWSQTLITSDRMLTELYQWWDVMQDIALQVNRPHGWGFQNIMNGEIRYMKLWQVGVCWSCLCHGGS